MSARSILFCRKIVKSILFASLLSCSAITTQCFAVVINFDELNPVYDEIYPCWCDNPLTDQYQTQGLLISGAWVNGENGHNSMLTSNFASLDFVGTLPTFFSFNINSVHDDAVLISIYGANGLISAEHTAGWTGPDTEYIPVIPDELFSFSAPQGVSHINIEGYYGLRTGANVDNITYTYSSVPEPSSLILACTGLFVLALTRRKPKRK